jgi:two-component system cell cycle sensor histidine kinase/response regulator CckA
MQMNRNTHIAPPTHDAAATRPEKVPETILVVEDEPDLRDLVVQVLESSGYHILEAASGKQALEQWKQRVRQIDLLLTDMVMPDGMTGCELAELLRADAPNLPVVYTSGHSAGIPGTQLADVQERHFLAKPYRPSKLVEIVRANLPATA